jgi:hypothetical protein
MTMMSEKDQALLAAVNEMEEQAPSVGLCGYPFKILRKEIAKLIEERDGLLAYREPKRVLPEKRYFGVGICPRCGVVFVNDSTPFCGNCGQALEWNQ